MEVTEFNFGSGVHLQVSSTNLLTILEINTNSCCFDLQVLFHVSYYLFVIEIKIKMVVLWFVFGEWSSSLDPSSGVVCSRVWVKILVMTLVPLSKALKHNCFMKRLGR